MSLQSLTARVVRGTIVAALLAACAGVSAAALLAHGLWERRERGVLRELAAELEQSIRREAGEQGAAGALERGVPEALREGLTLGRRVEVWRGSVLVGNSPAGAPIARPDELTSAAREAWLIETRPLGSGLLLLVASPRERGDEAVRIVLWSLALSAPVFLALALLVGRFVGARAAAPLLELRERLAAARPLEPLPPPAAALKTRELAELEAAFRELWARLGQTVSRELEFAANASHELRTPLTRIRLHAERAQAYGGPGAAELQGLVAEVERLVRLVDALLVLSRDLAAGLPASEVVNVADLAISTAARVFADGPAPLLELPDEALVRGDEGLLGIAIENLFENARKFTLPGATSRVDVREDGDGVHMAVTSPGARIAADIGERLFDRFYRGPQARAAGSGHGLGLPLARHVARLHGGEVRCTSGPDQDARFVMDLPAWAPARAGERGHASRPS